MSEPNPSSSKADPNTKKILVVDDEETVRMMVKMTLEAEGFQVKDARDGRNILKVAVDYHPDLIVSDLMMPGGGGYEVLRSLQSDDTTRKIPVILMTGASRDESTKAMIRQEPNNAGYIEKPIRLAAFLFEVHKILKTKSLEEKMIEQRNAQKSQRDGPNPFDGTF